MISEEKKLSPVTVAARSKAWNVFMICLVFLMALPRGSKTRIEYKNVTAVQQGQSRDEHLKMVLWARNIFWKSKSEWIENNVACWRTWENLNKAFSKCNRMLVPCHHGMARPQVADGGDAFQFWREATNILNKRSRTADKGWSSSLGVERGANNSP
jgi:hypothetical protein